jgi:multiple antibiotic resistance protein
LGETGSEALERFFAFILMCIGVQIFWEGFVDLWALLPAR